MTKYIFQLKEFSRTRNVAAALCMLLITASYGIAQEKQQLSKEDRHTLETYALSLDNLNKAITVQKEMEKILAADPNIEQSMKQLPGDTLEQQFKRLDSNPKIAGALHKSGLTARDWRLTQACTAIAYMVAKTKKDGTSPEQMKQIELSYPWKPSPEQLAFVEAHPAEIKKYMQPLDNDK